MRSFIFVAYACICLSSSLAAAADTSLTGLQTRVVGTWRSIGCELRPQQDPSDPKRAPVPSYLTRTFTYEQTGRFDANITAYADPACRIPVASYDIAGDIVWHGPNAAVPGAWSQDYVLNRSLRLTILAEPMVTQLNALPPGACGDGPFVLGQERDILAKPCMLLRFVDGNRFVVDHDFLYVRDDAPNLLFMGAKHVDGSGFYTPDNRPTVGLQQPLLKVR